MRLIRVVALCAALVATWLTPAAIAQADTTPDVYSTPGVHFVSGRSWKTTCSKYSTTVVRCTTDIYGTKVFVEKGRWYKQNDWVFNNMSYLPSPEAQWAANPLAKTGKWTATDGRKWRSECHTASTGRGACRNYIVATVGSETNGVVKQKEMEVFNSMIRFSTSSIPAVSSVPLTLSSVVSAPKPGPKTLLTVAGAKPAPAKPAPTKKPTTAPKPPKQTSVPGSGSSCPAGYPIKGNRNSKGEWIYHVPGGAFYSRTNPEECFATAAAARDAGYRASMR